MGQQLTLLAEDHDFVRRILGLGDIGEDVRRLQHALNREVYRLRRYLPIRLNEKILSKRLTPELWGYCWAPGALRQFRKRHLNRFKLEVPDPTELQDQPLKEDGRFGPKTEKAVIQYQRKVGLPDDGIVGPEVWGHLFPFWVVKIIVLDSASGTAALQNSSPSQASDTESESASAAPPERRFIGSPFAKGTLDNIAEQLGIQKDKDGLTAIFVLQATWKTESDPNEMVAGHWEHTGGLQVNTPIGRPGQNLQAYYQLTRAEVMSIDITDTVDLQADLWIQPTVQVPLDSGTPTKPNLTQVGVTVGATVSVEVKGDKDRPTVKVFAQGAEVATVDSRGKTAKGGQVVGGISVEYDADRFKPRQEHLEMTADPAVVTLKPGGSASVKIKVKPLPEKSASIDVGRLPAGVTANTFPDVILASQDSGVLHLSAAPNAPAANQRNILVSADLAGVGEKPKVASTRIQVIVAA